MEQVLSVGFGAPYVRLFFGDTELSVQVDDFEYIADEEGDDVITLVIEAKDRNTPDLPEWQEKSELKISWGYIKGPESHTRKIYIQDIKWVYNKDSVQATIQATEKAVSMKFVDSDEVYQNSSLLGVARRMAAKNDVYAFYEGQEFDGPEIIIPLKPGEWDDVFFKRNQDAIASRGLKEVQARAKTPQNKIAITKGLEEAAVANNANNRLAPFGARVKNPNQVLDLNLPNNWQIPKFGILPNAPQANKTDRQFLDELAAKEGYIIDSRDDEIIVKKRNFNQPPYKSYTFGSKQDGSLLSFVPMSKNWGHTRNAASTSFTGWNPLDKTVYTGNAVHESDPDGVLAKYYKVYKFYEYLDKKGLGDLRLSSSRYTAPFLPNIGNNNLEARIDNSGDYRRQVDLKSITVKDRLKALDAALATHRKMSNNPLYDPSANGPEEAHRRASNLRKNAELKMNPANATIMGDPLLMVGKIITILETSTKYSGNYYITKSVHRISKGNSYTTALHMVRQGYNLKTAGSKRTPKAVNTKTGPSGSKIKTVPIPTKTNPNG